MWRNVFTSNKNESFKHYHTKETVQGETNACKRTKGSMFTYKTVAEIDFDFSNVKVPSEPNCQAICSTDPAWVGIAESKNVVLILLV